MIRIEPLSPATLPACAEIAATAPDPWSAANLQTAMDDPRRLVLVALVTDAAGGEAAAGFACFIVIGEGADLEQLAIASAHRRRGLARALVACALPKLRQRGATRLLLEVRAGNAPALALYQSLGFKTLARRPGMYAHPQEDGFLMALGLGPQHTGC